VEVGESGWKWVKVSGSGWMREWPGSGGSGGSAGSGYGEVGGSRWKCVEVSRNRERNREVEEVEEVEEVQEVDKD
jgi:hypothetical protein